MLGQLTLRFKTNKKGGFSEEDKAIIRGNITNVLADGHNWVYYDGGSEIITFELENFEIIEPMRPLSTIYVDLGKLRMNIVDLMKQGATATNLEDFLQMVHKECINREL